MVLEESCLRKSLITRTKQLEEDLQAVTDKVEVHCFEVGKAALQLGSVNPRLNKFKRVLQALHARVDRSIASDFVLRNLLTDSEPNSPRKTRPLTTSNDAKLGKRSRQPN